MPNIIQQDVRTCSRIKLCWMNTYTCQIKFLILTESFLDVNYVCVVLQITEVIKVTCTVNQPQVQPVLQPLLPLQVHQLSAGPQPGKDRQRHLVI